MKLLRSTFIAFYVASDGASAFVAPAGQRRVASSSIFQPDTISSTSSASSPPSTTALFDWLHEPAPSDVTDEMIRSETVLRQVLREVSKAHDYLDYLVEQSSDASVEGEEEGGPTLGEVLAEKKEAAKSGEDVEVGLFGGGGDIPASAAPSQSKEEEQVYRPALRDDLGPTVLLTGTVDPSLLNVLNNNFFGQENVPNFDFTKIRALVDDVARARKGAISREARYGGLLDKLTIEQSSEGGAGLPTPEEMEGAGSWIAEVAMEDAAEVLPKIAALAKGSDDLNNLAVMVTGTVPSTGVVDGWDAVAEASDDGASFRATLLAVGELHDGPPDGFVRISDLSSEGTSTAFDSFAARLSRKRAYQIMAHSLALESAAGRALDAREYPAEAKAALATPYGEGEFVERDDDGKEIPDEMRDVKMEGRLTRGMREVGFTQVMELDVLVGKGIEAFKDFIENPPPERQSSLSTAKAKRDKEDERIMKLLDAEIAKSDARKAAEAAEERRIEIQGIAQQWATKEYSLRMLGGDLDDSVGEEEFSISVWDEALAEAETTYDRITSPEYLKEQERLEKEKADIGNKLFWEGMPPTLRKKREKLVEKVKRQYMDLLSEEELEQIILSD